MGVNPAKEFIRGLVSPGDEEFSPKHLAEFAVETLSDPHLEIRDLSIFLAYILALIADKANWPGQRERIRRRFALAVGRIPSVKLEYRMRDCDENPAGMKLRAGEEARALIAECGKVNDEAFVGDAVRAVRREALKLGVRLKMKA